MELGRGVRISVRLYVPFVFRLFVNGNVAIYTVKDGFWHAASV